LAEAVEGEAEFLAEGAFALAFGDFVLFVDAGGDLGDVPVGEAGFLDDFFVAEAFEEEGLDEVLALAAGVHAFFIAIERLVVLPA
jgi:hypothetical protein